jgi:hypothetical protein
MQIKYERAALLVHIMECAHPRSWLLTRRLRDLALFNPATTLDTDALAAMLYLREAQGASAAVWVDMGASVQAAAAGLQG